MSGEDIPLGAMNGARLPQRVEGHRLQWFGVLPPPVSSWQRPAKTSRRGDAAKFIQASRQLRMQRGAR